MNGIIDDLSILDYVKDPALEPSLSASIAHCLLTKSPAHAWLKHPRLNAAWEPEDGTAQEIGTIAHAILLENDRSRIAVISAGDYKKKAAQAARDAARLAGKLPVLIERYAQIEAMVEVARAALAASELAGIFGGAQIETTMVWEEGGTWFRSRPDVLAESWRLIIDYKTTGASAEPAAWARGQMLSFGYDVQAALALRGAAALLGPDDRKAIFMVQEIDPPYAVSFVGLDPQSIAFAEKKLAKATELWTACLSARHWPGYPSRICWASPPSWATYQFDEREAVEELARGNGQGEVAEL